MQDLVVQQKDGKISTKEFVNQAKELFPIQSGGSAVGGSTQPQQLQQLPHQPAQNIFPKTDVPFVAIVVSCNKHSDDKLSIEQLLH